MPDGKKYIHFKSPQRKKRGLYSITLYLLLKKTIIRSRFSSRERLKMMELVVVVVDSAGKKK